LGNTLREEAARLIKAGHWQAQLLSPQAWDPHRA
jgi:hypothetical protein